MLFEKDSAAGNMQKDIEFFALHDRPAFRFYGFNDDCITVGYSQDISSEIDLKKADLMGIEVAKRPTGGGIVFHSSLDIAFCCVLPSGMFPNGFMSAYHFVSDIVLAVLRQEGIMAEKYTNAPGESTNLCFSGAKEYEITLDGKKLVGVAQKRTKEKILQQGTICISRPQKDMVPVLKKQCDDKRYLRSAAMLNDATGEAGFPDALLSCMGKKFSEQFENLPFSML